MVCLFKTPGNRVEAPVSAGTPTEDVHPKSTPAAQKGRLFGWKYHWNMSACGAPGHQRWTRGPQASHSTTGHRRPVTHWEFSRYYSTVKVASSSSSPGCWPSAPSGSSKNSSGAWIKLWSCYAGYLFFDRSSCFLLLRRSIAICSLLCTGSSTLAAMKISDLDSSTTCTLR